MDIWTRGVMGEIMIITGICLLCFWCGGKMIEDVNHSTGPTNQLDYM